MASLIVTLAHGAAVGACRANASAMVRIAARSSDESLRARRSMFLVMVWGFLVRSVAQGWDV